MTITNKELFCKVFDMLQKNYEREVKIYNVMNDFGITLDDQASPLVRGVENILDTAFGFEEWELDYIYQQCYNDYKPEYQETAEEVWDKFRG